MATAYAHPTPTPSPLAAVGPKLATITSDGAAEIAALDEDIDVAAPTEQMLQWLDLAAEIGPDAYLKLWNRLLEGLTSKASVGWSEIWPELMIKAPSDRSSPARNSDVDHLVEHLHRSGHRRALIRQLIGDGDGMSPLAEDDAVGKAVYEVVRDFLAIGGRILISPDGELTTNGDVPPTFGAGDDAHDDELERAARAYFLATCCRRALPAIRELVGAFGVLQQNRWTVLRQIAPTALQAYSVWRTAVAEINGSDPDADTSAAWSLYEAAEAVLFDTDDLSPALGEAYLWMIVGSQLTERKHGLIAAAQDLPALEAIKGGHTHSGFLAYRAIKALRSGAPNSTSQLSPRLIALIEARRKTEAEWLGYRASTFNPMEAASIEARDSVPHQQTVATYTNVLGDRVSLSTQKWTVAQARTALANPAAKDDDYLVACQEVVQLDEERQRKLAEIDRDLGVDEAEAREEALVSADVDAAHLVIDFPAASIADVFAKLRFLIDAEWWADEASQAAILADLKRLQAGAPDQTVWDAARAVYDQAKEAEDRYEQEVWGPQLEQYEASRRPIDQTVNAEMGRLQDRRNDVETALMSIPSPGLDAFAFKFLVAFGDNREADIWKEMLEGEAKRFLDIGRQVAHG